MKKLFPILMASAMAVGVGFSLADKGVMETKASNEKYTVSFSYSDIPDGFVATTGTSGSFAAQVIAANDLTVDYAGINTKSSATAADHGYGYAMFLKNYGFINSHNSITDYYPSKLTVNIGSKSGESGKIGASFGSTLASVSARNSSVSGSVTKGESYSYTNSDKTKLFWNFSTTGANVQIDSFAIEYTSVNAAQKTITSIALQNDGTAKTVYYDGDSVSFSGIKAIATMSDSTTEDRTTECTITADKQKLATGDTKIIYSATHSSEIVIPDFELTITTSALVITKIEKNGNYRTNFVENQKLSFGTGNIKITYNNESTKTIPLITVGVQIFVGDTEITGQDYYMKLSDNGKNLKITYEGFNFTIPLTVESYTPHEVGYWSPITDVSELTDGMEVIIVASGHDYSMGKSEGGNNINAIETSKDGDNKISSNIPGVQVYVLEASTVVSNTFAFKANGVYLASGTSSNQLKTEPDITTQSSFAVSIVNNQMTIKSSISGDNIRNTIRFNNSDKIFSCYASDSTVSGSWACLYKFTAQGKTTDQIAVENFCKTALHLDETDTDNYIDPNDNTSGTACKGLTGYYEVAKAAYNELTDDQKDIFATSSDTIVNWGRQRLAAWAIANGESFDVTNHIFVATSGIINPANSSLVIILVTVGALLAISISLFAITRKKKTED